MADAEEAGARLRTGGYELAVGGSGDGGGGGGSRVLGSRQLARYYRQSYRPADARRSVAVATVLAQYAPLHHESAYVTCCNGSAQPAKQAVDVPCRQAGTDHIVRLCCCSVLFSFHFPHLSNPS